MRLFSRFRDVCDYWRGMDWLMDSLTTYTHLRTTSNYSATASLRTLQITIAAAKFFPACYVFISSSLSTASNLLTVEILQLHALMSYLHSLPCKTQLGQNQSHIATDRQSVLVWSPIWDSWPDIYYCLTVTVLFFVGRPLWWKDGSVFCVCCWPLPEQSFSCPSPLILSTIFYCLRFKTSLFVASYYSLGHCGGIRPRLNTGELL
jgi:hypothetical protein